MPSSLTVNLSSALVYSTRPPVSVYGTGACGLMLRRFSREPGYPGCPLARRLAVLSPLGSEHAFYYVPHRLTGLNALFRQRARVSLLRLSFAAAAGGGILTASSIAFASRLMLRSRLTLIRLALIRKPWSYGGRVSRPPYRYLYLHLLFRRLHRPSMGGFCAGGMLPYQPRTTHGSTSSAPDLCPIIIHARPLDR